MAQNFTVNLHLPNDMRIAIGDVTAFWSFLEFQVEQIIHHLLGIGPKQGRIVTTQMNIRPKTEIVTLLMKVNEVDPKFADEFAAILLEINTLQTERNKVVHGLWARQSQPGFFDHYLLWFRGKPENRILGDARPMTAPDVRAIAAQIDNLNSRLDRLLYGLRMGEFPPSDDTQQ